MNTRLFASFIKAARWNLRRAILQSRCAEDRKGWILFRSWPGRATIAPIFFLATLIFSPPGLIGAVQHADVNFALVERAAGPIRSVSVRGSYAYVGVGYKLLVFSVLVPHRPLLVSENAALPAQVEGLAVTKRYAYVAAGKAGLFIYDIASPTAPVLVGSLMTPATAQAVAVADRYAYVATGANGLRIIDVHNAAVPVEVGFYDNPGLTIRNVAVQGAYAYVTTTPSGLHVLDVTDPAVPTEIGSTALLGNARGIVVAQQYAYIAAGRDGLRIVDISNPQQPHEVGFSTKTVREDAYGVAIAGDRVYLADRSVPRNEGGSYPGGLRIIDVSSPSSPVQLGNLTGDVWSVDTRRGHAYIADYDTIFGETSSFDVANVQDPAEPQRIASFSIPPSASAPIVASGTDLYVINDHLYRFDLSDPQQPHLAWSLPLSGDTYFPGKLTGLAIDGAYAYVGGGTAGLHIVSLANAVRPRLVITVPVEAYDVAASANLIFVSELYGGLHIVDISDPTNARVLSEITGNWSVTEMQAMGDYLYVSPYPGSALLIYSIQDPAQPILVSSFPTGNESPSHIEIAGSYAYLAIGLTGASLMVVDVSDPTQPRLVSELAVTPYHISDMTLAGNSIYLTLPVIPGGGLRAIDVSDPANPCFDGAYLMSSQFTNAVARLPGEVVALGSSDGLLFLQQTPSP